MSSHRRLSDRDQSNVEKGTVLSNNLCVLCCVRVDGVGFYPGHRESGVPVESLLARSKEVTREPKRLFGYP